MWLKYIRHSKNVIFMQNVAMSTTPEDIILNFWMFACFWMKHGNSQWSNRFWSATLIGPWEENVCSLGDNMGRTLKLNGSRRVVWTVWETDTPGDCRREVVTVFNQFWRHLHGSTKSLQWDRFFWSRNKEENICDTDNNLLKCPCQWPTTQTSSQRLFWGYLTYLCYDMCQYMGGGGWILLA